MSKKVKEFKCSKCNWKFNVGYNRIKKEQDIYCSSCKEKIPIGEPTALAVTQEL